MTADAPDPSDVAEAGAAVFSTALPMIASLGMIHQQCLAAGLTEMEAEAFVLMVIKKIGELDG